MCHAHWILDIERIDMCLSVFWIFFKAMMKKHHDFCVNVHFVEKYFQKKKKIVKARIVSPQTQSISRLECVRRCARCHGRFSRLNKLHSMYTFFNWFALYKLTLAFYFQPFEMIMFLRARIIQYVFDCFWIFVYLSKFIEKIYMRHLRKKKTIFTNMGG